jgi:hypothetical protein
MMVTSEQIESFKSEFIPAIESNNRSPFTASVETHSSSERPLWLFSRRADFWLASGGASAALLASLLVISWHGDRELDALDFVLSEFHLGATYNAVIHRRLWRHRRVEVLLIPLFILALTYVLSATGQAMLITSVAMYTAVWHRGRQSLGVARYYQRAVGGRVSRAHDILFRGAIYLPMVAATLAYTHLAPIDYEGQPYFALNFGSEMTSVVGWAAALWVIAYLTWTLLLNRGERLNTGTEAPSPRVHPGEWWVVVAHAVAFSSGYVLGASNASFLLVLAVHHEVQYLYFTYAMARRPDSFRSMRAAPGAPAGNALDLNAAGERRRGLRFELKSAAAFLLWPVIGFVGAMVGDWSELEWLAPLGIGGLFCHYWLDARIWTRRSFQN